MEQNSDWAMQAKNSSNNAYFLSYGCGQCKWRSKTTNSMSRTLVSTTAATEEDTGCVLTNIYLIGGGQVDVSSCLD